MNTSKVGRTVAATAAIAATFFATTACGVEQSATGSISKPAQAPSAEKSVNKESYPADGRENRSPEKSYPADGRENRNPSPGAFSGEQKKPVDW